MSSIRSKSVRFEEKVIASHYQHVDNGGLTIEVIERHYENGEYGGTILRVREGYYGYSEHTLEFTQLDSNHLRKFGQMFILAANKIEIAANEDEDDDEDSVCAAQSVEVTSAHGPAKSYWMIERTDVTTPEWLAVLVPLTWTTNASEAQHFSSKETAEVVKEYVRRDPSPLVVTQHGAR